ncbi:nucleotidyltransferase [Bacteroidia bacterium]|nr:nucleotidyltransferase [Bacteroidia bacterium]
MNNFFQLSNQNRIEVVNQAVIRKKLPPEAIEKDVWVTAVLRSLFALPYAEQISFKGGTSLSKCWNVIERFSEDVDVAINREYFGFVGENLSKRDVNKKLRKAACTFCRETLQFDLAKQMMADGIPESQFSVTMEITDSSTVDPEKIFINYKSLFAENQNYHENYIKPVVVLEVNGRSMKEPLEKVKIKSFVDEVFADRTFAEKPFEIQAVVPERTFLEKICLLHEEFAKKEQDKIRVNRMSRHLYDIAMMLKTPIAEKALKDTDLYKHIIAHRKTFIGLTEFDYNTLLPQTISIIPPENIIDKWSDDYAKMQTIIYGKAPTFEEIIEKIKNLEKRIRQIPTST